MPMLAKLMAVVAAVAVADEVDSALRRDDQCGSGECGLSAVQLRGVKGEELLELEKGAKEVEGEEAHEGWLKDITTKEKNHFKHILAPLQKPIVTNYQYLVVLDSYANYTMEKIENATGSEVVWNRKSLLQQAEEEMEQEEMEDASTYGRRRRSVSGADLPPRARYINKILIYLNKEMDAVWNLNTIVDRKRWGVGNTITSSPYGPHGEHPERWRANGTFPLPLAAPVSPVLNLTNTLTMRIKPEEHKYDNKYAQQLQADYQSLIDNINDASKKGNDLRSRLFKMDVYANQFIALPSGVWNKIDAQR
ncbi:unnamed protein product [Effrenium voratum]|uniref:Uncharacterized protein n=1 Tax=Effrenium voratum TaxID=2562239 RepID=A0AA36I9X2_9DINO|nr:unnamed protein product [Effrenium voratum]